MTKFKVLGVTVLLGLLIIGGAWAASENGDTTVYWSASCWIKLSVHGDVDLGTIDAITFATGYLESTGNEVVVQSNCVAGYTLKSEAIATTTPSSFAGDILADFYWWVDSYTGPLLISVQNSETNFTALNVQETVASSSNPATHHFDMGYKYYIDTDDIHGDYSVTIRYTATSL